MDTNTLTELVAGWLVNHPEIVEAAVLPENPDTIGITDEDGADHFLQVQPA